MGPRNKKEHAIIRTMENVPWIPHKLEGSGGRESTGLKKREGKRQSVAASPTAQKKLFQVTDLKQ